MAEGGTSAKPTELKKPWSAGDVDTRNTSRRSRFTVKELYSTLQTSIENIRVGREATA